MAGEMENQTVFAIIKEGGRQFKVSEGDTILIDLKPLDEGSEVRFDKVLMVDGNVGKPFLEGACVTGKVEGEVKGKKIYVQKFRRRKNYRRRVGHRQHYTQVKIESIQS